MSGLKSQISWTWRSVKPPPTGMTVQPKIFRAVMQAEAAGEQTIAVGNLHLVARLAAGGADRARDEHGPGFDVAAGVAHHGRLAGWCRSSMDPHDLAHRDGEHAERIVLAQVFLGGERKFFQIVEARDSCGLHLRRRELFLIVRDVPIGAGDHLPDPRELERPQFVDAGRLDCFERVERRRAQLLPMLSHHVSPRPLPCLSSRSSARQIARFTA